MAIRLHLYVWFAWLHIEYKIRPRAKTDAHGVTDAVNSGIFNIQAQERVVFGMPAPEAVAMEAEHFGARRVFVTSTRSLAALEHGPLQLIESALGQRYAGTFSAIASHSPAADVIAAANAARSAGADMLVAVGGGSVVDAT